MNTWRILRPPLTAAGVLAGQLAHAAFREDLPSLENQDPSGTFGEPDSPPLNLAFLGDSSITAPGVEPLDSSWPRVIAIHLSQRFCVTAHSVAVGGSKARDVLADQLDAALDFSPDIAYLSVGSNDALRGTPIQRFEAEYDEIVGRLHEAVPAVGLSGIGDLGTIPRLPSLAQGIARIRSRATDRAVARVAANYHRSVKSNAWSVMESAFAADPALYGDDLFHASAEGHELFGELGVAVADQLVDIWQASEAVD